MYLHGRLALLEVLKVFKTDLFMSSLTDSSELSPPHPGQEQQLTLQPSPCPCLPLLAARKTGTRPAGPSTPCLPSLLRHSSPLWSSWIRMDRWRMYVERA